MSASPAVLPHPLRGDLAEPLVVLVHEEDLACAYNSY